MTRPLGIALLPALVILAWRAPDKRAALLRLAVAPALFALYLLVTSELVLIGYPPRDLLDRTYFIDAAPRALRAHRNGSRRRRNPS